MRNAHVIRAKVPVPATNRDVPKHTAGIDEDQQVGVVAHFNAFGFFGRKRKTDDRVPDARGTVGAEHEEPSPLLRPDGSKICHSGSR